MMSQPVPPSRENAATIAARKPVPAVTAPAVSRGPARAPLDRAQEALPGPLRRLPLQVLLASSGLAAASVLVLVLGLARSDKAVLALEEDTPAAEPTATPTATASPRGTIAGIAAPSTALEPSATDLDTARSKGAGALKDLAQRFPKNRGVLQALVVAEAQDKKDHPAAVADARRLLEIAPDKAADKEVQQALFDIANDVPPPDTAGDAIGLMKSKMGTQGPDMLYEILLRTGSTKSAKDRAAAALAEPAVLKSGSKALQVAEELRRMTACNRKTLVDRVKIDGDKRSVPWLRALSATKPCGGGFGGLKALLGGGDCGPVCATTPTERKAIADAIEAADRRDPAAARSAAPATPAPSAIPASQGGGMLK